MRGDFFFDKYPEFLASPVSSGIVRLVERYRRIICWNRDAFVGSNVLDLACHDGRWSVAAIEAGASKVSSVDRNPVAIQNALSICQKHRISAISFECRDAYEFVRECRPDYDVVLCLGYFYHMPGHALLFEEFRRLAPRLVVLDTQLSVRRPRLPFIECFAEGGNDKPACSFERRVVGKPNHAYIKLLRDTYLPAYSLERYPRCQELDSSLSDYTTGRRHTYRLSTSESAAD